MEAAGLEHLWNQRLLQGVFCLQWSISIVSDWRKEHWQNGDRAMDGQGFLMRVGDGRLFWVVWSNRRGSVVQVAHKGKAGSERKGTEYTVPCNFLFLMGLHSHRPLRGQKLTPVHPRTWKVVCVSWLVSTLEQDARWEECKTQSGTPANLSSLWMHSNTCTLHLSICQLLLHKRPIHGGPTLQDLNTTAHLQRSSGVYAFTQVIGIRDEETRVL